MLSPCQLLSQRRYPEVNRLLLGLRALLLLDLVASEGLEYLLHARLTHRVLAYQALLVLHAFNQAEKLADGCAGVFVCALSGQLKLEVVAVVLCDSDACRGEVAGEQCQDLQGLLLDREPAVEGLRLYFSVVRLSFLKEVLGK